MVELQDWARDRPVFTLNEAHRRFDLKRASLRETLSRMTRRGEIQRIERGLYTVHTDPMIYASYVETPSYLSFWSALRYYDHTTQQPSTVQVVVATTRPNLSAVRFYQTSRLFGFGRRPYDGFEIFVADRERLLLDCLTRDVVAVSDLGELLTAIDIDRAAAYASRFGSNATKKRMGYLLERVHDVTVEELTVSDRNYPVLDLTEPDEGAVNSDWRLRVNTDVV